MAVPDAARAKSKMRARINVVDRGAGTKIIGTCARIMAHVLTARQGIEFEVCLLLILALLDPGQSGGRGPSG
jgi:hypothetical protein